MIWLRSIKCVLLLQDRYKLLKPGEEAIKAMLAWGVSIETDSARSVSKSQIKRKMSKMSLVSAQKVVEGRLDPTVSLLKR